MFQKPIEEHLNKLKEMKWIDDWHILKKITGCDSATRNAHEGSMFDAFYIVFQGDYYTVFWANKIESVEQIAGYIVIHAHKFEF